MKVRSSFIDFGIIENIYNKEIEITVLIILINLELIRSLLYLNLMPNRIVGISLRLSIHNCI